MDLTWRQINCKKSIAGDTFAGGALDFEFSIGSKTKLLVDRSYFRIGMNLIGRGATEPKFADKIALADNACAALFTNASFYAGGQEISSCSNGLAVAHMVRQRISASNAWLNSYQDTQLMEADYQKRVNKYCDADSKENAYFSSPQDYKLVSLSDTDVNDHTYTVAVGIDGKVTGVQTTLNAGPGALLVGSQILLGGQIFTVTVPPSTALGGNLTVSPAPAIAIAATTGVVKIVPNETQGKNHLYGVYVPPLGIFQYKDGLYSGDYRVSLMPNANFKIAAVEKLYGEQKTGTDFDLKITSIDLFVCTYKSDTASTFEKKFELVETQVHNQDISNADSTFDFSLPTSTSMISMLFQDKGAGTTTRFPATKFTCQNRDDLKLSSFQITYSGVTKPASRYSSEFTLDNTNKFQQRFLESAMETQQYFSPGGGENFTDWMLRGPLYTQSWIRAGDDRGTNMQLNLQFSTAPVNARVFIVCQYTRQVTIYSEHGFITNIESKTV